MSSKSVARSAGLRSIRRARQVGPPFPSAPPGSRRPVARSVQVSPVGFVCISSVRFVPSVPFVACSSSPVRFVLCLFRSSCSLLSVFFVSRSDPVQLVSCFVSLVSRSVSFRFALLSVRLVRFRLILVQVSFGLYRLQLSLFCARAFSRADYLYYSRVYYTLKGAKGK